MWRGAPHSQVRLLHRALLRLSKGCGQPRRVRAFSLTQSRRARLSIARHRPQPRGFRGNALRPGSHHVSAEVSAISISASLSARSRPPTRHSRQLKIFHGIYTSISTFLLTLSASTHPPRCQPAAISSPAAPNARYIPICTRAPRKIAPHALPRHLEHARRQVRRRKPPCYKAS